MYRHRIYIPRYTFLGYTFLGYTFLGYTFLGNTFLGYTFLGLTLRTPCPYQLDILAYQWYTINEVWLLTFLSTFKWSGENMTILNVLFLFPTVGLNWVVNEVPCRIWYVSCVKRQEVLQTKKFVQIMDTIVNYRLYGSNVRDFYRWKE